MMTPFVIEALEFILKNALLIEEVYVAYQRGATQDMVVKAIREAMVLASDEAMKKEL